MADITPQQLLAEVNDLLRTMPPWATIRHNKEENHAWLGRACAIVGMWDAMKLLFFENYISDFHTGPAIKSDEGYRKIITTLHQARYDLQLKTVGPMTKAIDGGDVFDYFDEIRKQIETSKEELFFVDPYLDAEFASRYLPHAQQGIKIRLLTFHKLATLMPAVELFRQQKKITIEIRSVEGLHDRYLFVDRQFCFQSGASFKDGAKKAPTTLTQISDAFSAMWETYNRKWESATPQLLKEAA